jgi:hypothetical protein
MEQLSHHPTLTPSAFPALAQCPCYQSGEAGEAAERGTLQHEALAMMLTPVCGDEVDARFVVLTETEREQVKWAADWVLDNLSLEYFVEERLELLDDNFEVVTFGTADIIDPMSGWLVDYKSGEMRDYKAQMATYALMAMDRWGLPRLSCAVLYGRYREVERFNLTRAEAEAIVWPIIRSVADGQPAPCDYCGWCANAAACPALAERALTVAGGREDWKLETYHPSQIADPQQMGRALHLARLLKKWAEAVEHHARQMFVVENVPLPPGWKTQARGGKRTVSDIMAAYERAGLTPEQFIACCQLSLPKLEESFALAQGLKKAQVKRELESRLDGLLVAGGESKMIVREKEIDDAEAGS